MRKNRFRPILDRMEGRLLLSNSSASPYGLTPAQIEGAYGVPGGQGQGKEIAIVVVGNNPNVQADLNAYDAQYGLPNTTISIHKLGNVPNDTANPAGGGDAFETDLDVQQAHQIAPYAKIDLIETESSTMGLLQGMQWAAANTGASAVSCSYSLIQTESQQIDQLVDGMLTQPAGRNVVYLFPSGDSGPSNTSNYAFSPNVLTVGGTNLTVNGTSYGGESVWAPSGGAVSQYEPHPLYQWWITDAYSSSHRASTDVSWDAGTPVSVYDSLDFGTVAPWSAATGTSIGPPSWAATIAILDQALNAWGRPDLNSDTVHADLYQLEASPAFHPIGGNYNIQTGIGTPWVGQLETEFYYLDTIYGAASGTGGRYPDGHVGFDTYGSSMLMNGVQIGPFRFSCTLTQSGPGGQWSGYALVQQTTGAGLSEWLYLQQAPGAGQYTYTIVGGTLFPGAINNESGQVLLAGINASYLTTITAYFAE